MNALFNLLPAYFNPSPSQSNGKDINKRAVDPSSNANGGFANNSSQKTSFPPGTSKPTPTTSASKAVSSSVSASASASLSSSSILSVTSSSTSPSATLPPPPLNGSSTLTSTTPTISPSSNADNSNGGGGLSGGAIGAIVAVIIIVIGGIFAFLFIRRRRQKRMAARTGAGAMRDPYNEGFTSFPPPPAPMAFTSDPYHSPTSPVAPAAGSAQYQPQLTQPPPSSYNYPPYPITAPDMISTPPMSSSNAPATMATPTNPIINTPTNPATTIIPPTPGDIWQQPPIGTFTVLTTYTPTLSDEIDVQPNDQVQIFEEYDDGWCLGINITRGQKRGVFPKHCVTPEEESNPSSHSLVVTDPSSNATANKRVSSLYMENPPQLQ